MWERIRNYEIPRNLWLRVDGLFNQAHKKFVPLKFSLFSFLLAFNLEQIGLGVLFVPFAYNIG